MSDSITAASQVLLGGIFTLASVGQGFASINLIKNEEVWDRLFKHTYTKSQHPGFFWFHVTCRVLASLGWALMAFILLTSFNPFTGRPFHLHKPSQKVAVLADTFILTAAQAVYAGRPNLSFNSDPTVRDYCHALNIRLSVGPVNFVR